MPQLRRNFVQRIQYKLPLRDARMRNFEIFRRHHNISVKKNIQIDRARTFRNRPLPFQPSLDFLNQRQ